MSFAQFLPFAVFCGITFLAWYLFNAFSSPSRASERLDELRDPSLRNRDEGGNGNKQSGMGAMLEKAAPTLSKAMQPKTELEQSKLKTRLANAGFNADGASQIFLATKVILLLAGALAGGGLGLVSWGFTQKGMVSVVFGGAAGMFLPEIVLFLLIRARQEKIFLSLPDALDLLVVCVESGLGLDAGMRRVAEELTESAPEVSYEMQTANMQLQMGRPRRDVLHDLGVRTGVDDMKALAATLIQADKFGSSIAKALRVQSDGMRVKRRQYAEERAQQTAVKMIFPLVVFIFPGIFVILVGPAAIMMIEKLLK